MQNSEPSREHRRLVPPGEQWGYGALLFPYRDNNLNRVFASDQMTPDEFLYGGRQFILSWGVTRYFNTRRGGRRSLLRVALYPVELIFRLQTRLGLPLEMVFEHWAVVRNAKLIICSSDAISFLFLVAKSLGLIDASVVVVFQSLSERHRKYFSRNWIMVKMVQQLLRQADYLMTLTTVSTHYLTNTFELEPSKTGIFTFGVDKDYWNYMHWSPERQSILVVGNDMNRDYNKLSELLNDGVKITLVSTRRVPDHPNLTKLTGISNESLRKLYHRARLVFLPILPLQTEASGLSVALQSMACGTPVCVARNPALQEIFSHKKDVLFYDHNQAGWKTDILRLYQDDTLLAELSRGGRKLIEEQRSSRVMYEELRQIVNQNDRTWSRIATKLRDS